MSCENVVSLVEYVSGVFNVENSVCFMFVCIYVLLTAYFLITVS